MHKILPSIFHLTAFLLLLILFSPEKASAQTPGPFQCGSAYTAGNCTNSLVGIDCSGPPNDTGINCCNRLGAQLSLDQGATINGFCDDTCGVFPGNVTCPRDGTNSCLGSSCSGTSAFCCNYAYAQCAAPPNLRCNYVDVDTAQGVWTTINSGNYLLKACPNGGTNPNAANCSSSSLTSLNQNNINLPLSIFANYNLFVRLENTTNKCTAPGIWSPPAACLFYQITANVYVDTNENKVWDQATESVYKDGAWVARSSDGTGFTNSSGIYVFNGVATGTYTISLTVPPGYKNTTELSVSATVPPSPALVYFGIKPLPSPSPTPACRLDDSVGVGYRETCTDPDGTYTDSCSGTQIIYYDCVNDRCSRTTSTNCSNFAQACVVQANGQPSCVNPSPTPTSGPTPTPTNTPTPTATPTPPATCPAPPDGSGVEQNGALWRCITTSIIQCNLPNKNHGQLNCGDGKVCCEIPLPTKTPTPTPTPLANCPATAGGGTITSGGSQWQCLTGGCFGSAIPRASLSCNDSSYTCCETPLATPTIAPQPTGTCTRVDNNSDGITDQCRGNNGWWNDGCEFYQPLRYNCSYDKGNPDADPPRPNTYYHCLPSAGQCPQGTICQTLTDASGGLIPGYKCVAPPPTPTPTIPPPTPTPQPCPFGEKTVIWSSIQGAIFVTPTPPGPTPTDTPGCLALNASCGIPGTTCCSGLVCGNTSCDYGFCSNSCIPAPTPNPLPPIVAAPPTPVPTDISGCVGLNALCSSNTPCCSSSGLSCSDNYDEYQHYTSSTCKIVPTPVPYNSASGTTKIIVNMPGACGYGYTQIYSSVYSTGYIPIDQYMEHPDTGTRASCPDQTKQTIRSAGLNFSAPSVATTIPKGSTIRSATLLAPTTAIGCEAGNLSSGSDGYAHFGSGQFVQTCTSCQGEGCSSYCSTHTCCPFYCGGFYGTTYGCAPSYQPSGTAYVTNIIQNLVNKNNISYTSFQIDPYYGNHNCNGRYFTAYSSNFSVSSGAALSITYCIKPSSIQGNIFMDNNKNRIKDASENNFIGLPKQQVEFRKGHNSCGTGELVTRFQQETDGTYNTGELLNKGDYSVCLVTGLPLGYQLTFPISLTIPYFNVTVGEACSVPTIGGVAVGTCDANGNITNLNFGITNSIPWIQSIGRDMRSDRGFNFGVPVGKYASLTGTGGTPGIIFFGKYLPNFGGGQGSETPYNWAVGGTSSPNIDTYRSSHNLVTTSYEYQLGIAKDYGLPIPDLSTHCGADGIGNCILSSTLPNNVYIANGDLKINNTTPYTFPQDKDYVFLVNGNLTINQKILVPIGSSATFSVKGNISVDKEVGEQIVGSEFTDIEGFYSTDKSFIVKGNNDCALGTDRRLNIGGTVVVNAALSGGEFIIKRDLCGGSVEYPTVYFKERLDLILNSPRLIQQPIKTFREVPPK